MHKEADSVVHLVNNATVLWFFYTYVHTEILLNNGNTFQM